MHRRSSNGTRRRRSNGMHRRRSNGMHRRRSNGMHRRSSNGMRRRSSNGVCREGAAECIGRGELNSSANGLYRLRKTLAPEKGGDPPQGGEDFPGRYRPSLHRKHGQQPFLLKGSECPRTTNRCNHLYICALAHHLQYRYSLPFTENTENSPFC